MPTLTYWTLIVALFSVPLFAQEEGSCDSIDKKRFPTEHEACVQMSQNKPGGDCVDCVKQEGDGDNEWAEAVSELAGPLAKRASAYLDSDQSYDDNNEKWSEAWKEAHEKRRSFFLKFLKERESKGQESLSPVALKKEFQLYEDYHTLKEIAGESSSFPSYEEFKKDPSAYMTKSGWEVHVHLPEKNDDLENCSHSKEQSIVCPEGTYIFQGADPARNINDELIRKAKPDLERVPSAGDSIESSSEQGTSR